MHECLFINLLRTFNLWRAHFDLLDSLSSVAASKDPLDRLVRLCLSLSRQGWRKCDILSRVPSEYLPIFNEIDTLLVLDVYGQLLSLKVDIEFFILLVLCLRRLSLTCSLSFKGLQHLLLSWRILLLSLLLVDLSVDLGLLILSVGLVHDVLKSGHALSLQD